MFFYSKIVNSMRGHLSKSWSSARGGNDLNMASSMLQISSLQKLKVDNGSAVAVPERPVNYLER